MCSKSPRLLHDSSMSFRPLSAQGGCYSGTVNRRTGLEKEDHCLATVYPQEQLKSELTPLMSRWRGKDLRFNGCHFDLWELWRTEMKLFWIPPRADNLSSNKPARFVSFSFRYVFHFDNDSQVFFFIVLITITIFTTDPDTRPICLYSNSRFINSYHSSLVPRWCIRWGSHCTITITQISGKIDLSATSSYDKRFSILIFIHLVHRWY